MILLYFSLFLFNQFNNEPLSIFFALMNGIHIFPGTRKSFAFKPQENVSEENVKGKN